MMDADMEKKMAEMKKKMAAGAEMTPEMKKKHAAMMAEMEKHSK
jgi:hypothetical protein